MIRKPGYKAGPRDQYTSPKKGTKRRKLILLLLRKQGVTTAELLDYGISNNNIHGWEWLRSECGFHIKIIGKFKTPGERNSKRIYRIVGRYRWTGSYRSFLKENSLT